MEAIIFMLGLGPGLNDQSLNAFAYRYMKAVDINDPDEKKQFNVIGFFLLSGIRVHGMYWEDQLNSSSCLTTLVSQRLENENH